MLDPRQSNRKRSQFVSTVSCLVDDDDGGVNIHFPHCVARRKHTKTAQHGDQKRACCRAALCAEYKYAPRGLQLTPRSLFLPDSDPDKHSLRSPPLAFESIERTIKTGDFKDRIIEDLHRVFDTTCDRIIEAKGCYIEDSASSCRHGVRADA